MLFNIFADEDGVLYVTSIVLITFEKKYVCIQHIDCWLKWALNILHDNIIIETLNNEYWDLEFSDTFFTIL